MTSQITPVPDLAESKALTIDWRSLGKVVAPPEAPPVVILPGFGNDTGDYECPFGDKDAAIATALRNRGWRVFVVPLERRDWLNVGRSVLSRDYWTSNCTCDPGYRWYLNRVRSTVDMARCECLCDQVDLIGHSAGGWLGRAFTGDPLGFDSPPATPDVPHQGVRTLVTLGTPQRPPPAELGRDMTGGALRWVDVQWPGAHFASAGLRYVCVAGRSVTADRNAPRRTLARYAHSSYSQVCGDGHAEEGDCVVPLSSAHLPGAKNVVLEGVYHSTSRVGTYGQPAERPWYGSDTVVDAWAQFLV
ncbi:hypothetical protein WJX81_006068 [Elliptochloris bilobata]|uniref:Chlorophyllase n=1 Tax=Elliptochloris bilobata TaxID=381761 RepID=A0AAW1QK12_9CHLO